MKVYTKENYTRSYVDFTMSMKDNDINFKNSEDFPYVIYVKDHAFGLTYKFEYSETELYYNGKVKYFCYNSKDTYMRLKLINDNKRINNIEALQDEERELEGDIEALQEGIENLREGMI